MIAPGQSRGSLPSSAAHNRAAAFTRRTAGAWRSPSIMSSTVAAIDASMAGLEQIEGADAPDNVCMQTFTWRDRREPSAWRPATTVGARPPVAAQEITTPHFGLGRTTASTKLVAGFLQRTAPVPATGIPLLRLPNRG